MTTYTANAIKHATLTAATVDTVTLGSDFNRAEVFNRGTAELYFTVDGVTAPTVAGDECFMVPAGGALQVDILTAASTVVKLISSSATAYSVTGVWVYR